MSNEVALLVGMREHRAGDQLDHLVATPVAVAVVEGLEVVEVGVADDKVGAAFERALDVFADRNVSKAQ